MLAWSEYREYGGTFEISSLGGLCEEGKSREPGVGNRMSSPVPARDLSTHIWKDTEPIVERGAREGFREQHSTSPRNSHAGSLLRRPSNVKVTLGKSCAPELARQPNLEVK